MTSLLRSNSSLSSLTSLSSESSSGFVVLLNKSYQISPHDDQMNANGLDQDISDASALESQSLSSEPLSNAQAVFLTAKPLKEEKTEPWYEDDTRKAPQPSPEEIMSYGIKIRDFAYESKLPPIPSYVRPKLPPMGVQKQPDPSRWIGAPLVVEAPMALARLNTDGLFRQKVFYDLESLEEFQSQSQSQRSNNSSPVHSQSQPPLEYITSQESEDVIQTPMVTPNGSLQWKDTSHIPIDELDSGARTLEADMIPEPKSLPGRIPDSPEPSATELTLPNLSSLPASPTTRLASEALPGPIHPPKRRRMTPSEPSSPTTVASPLNDHDTSPSSQPIAPSSRYHLRSRHAAVAGPEPPSRGFSVQSSQSKSPTKKNVNRNKASSSGNSKARARIGTAKTRGRR